MARDTMPADIAEAETEAADRAKRMTVRFQLMTDWIIKHRSEPSFSSVVASTVRHYDRAKHKERRERVRFGQYPLDCGA